MIDEFFDPEKDTPRIKTLELDNNKMLLKRTDPYGFISVHFERGQVPESLRGNYTTWEAAHAAVDQYLKEKGREVKPEALAAPLPDSNKKKIA